MFYMNSVEIKELEEAVHRELFEEKKKRGENPMCSTFPSNGVYVASGIVRAFNSHGSNQVDMLTYFRKLKYGDLCDFKESLKVMKE